MKTSTTFHVGLHVSDITSSIAFYRDLLNSEPVKTKSDYAKFETDAIVLSLIRKPGATGPGFGHFGLKVADVQALHEQQDRIRKAGHDLLVEDHVDCCYALQDKFWVNDPDGYNWEVYTFIEDTHEGIRPEAAAGPSKDEAAAEACCAPSCC